MASPTKRSTRWDEKEMRWASLPGCTDDGPDLNRARKLAEFWIPRGGSGGPLTVRGDALAEFIRHDTNGLVSFPHRARDGRDRSQRPRPRLCLQGTSHRPPADAAPEMTFPAMKKLSAPARSASPPPPAFAADDDAQRAAMKFFENEVRPILANRCYECHGEKKQKGSLRLDNIALHQDGRRFRAGAGARAIRTSR